MAPYPSATKTWHTSSYAGVSPSRPELSLTGKAIVITGGGSGIGLSISRAYALAGASKIAIIGRRPQILQEAVSSIQNLVGIETEIITISANIADKAQVDNAMSEIRKTFGQQLDVLVSNAGYYSGPRPLGTESAEDWQTNLEVNISGLYLTTMAFIQNAKPNATLINVSSGVVHRAPAAGFASYAVSKIAGAKLMEYVQFEKPLLHVVNVHPGEVVETDLALKIAQALGQALDHIDDGT